MIYGPRATIQSSRLLRIGKEFRLLSRIFFELGACGLELGTSGLQLAACGLGLGRPAPGFPGVEIPQTGK